MRSLDSAISDALVAPVVRFITFVRLDLDSGTRAWHNWHGDYDIDGVTYTGIGVLGSVSTIREEPGIKPASVSVTVSGVKPAVVSLLLSEPYLGRKAKIHYHMMDEHGAFLSASPILAFRGAIDDIGCELGQQSTFTLTLRSRLADWERPRKLRYTDADQRKLYPDDKGMEFVAQLSQKKLIWPKAKFLPDPRD